MPLSRFAKWSLWILGTIAALVVSAVLLLSWLLSDTMEPSKDEVARVVSPNGKADAVLIETNGGATTSFGYEVHILEHGAQPSDTPNAFFYGAVRSQQAYGLNMKWEAPNLLAIEYLSAKSKDASKPSVSIAGEAIQLVVREGVFDQSAPSGGMLYNLRGRR